MIKVIDVSVVGGKLNVDLENGRTISVPIGWYPRLAHGTVPLGQPLPRSTDEDAAVTLKDIEQAMGSARKYGSPAFIAMLDAKSTGNKDSK